MEVRRQGVCGMERGPCHGVACMDPRRLAHTFSDSMMSRSVLRNSFDATGPSALATPGMRTMLSTAVNMASQVP